MPLLRYCFVARSLRNTIASLSPCLGKLGKVTLIILRLRLTWFGRFKNAARVKFTLSWSKLSPMLLLARRATYFPCWENASNKIHLQAGPARSNRMIHVVPALTLRYAANHIAQTPGRTIRLMPNRVTVRCQGRCRTDCRYNQVWQSPRSLGLPCICVSARSNRCRCISNYYKELPMPIDYVFCIACVF